jgi:hypothetical protein
MRQGQMGRDLCIRQASGVRLSSSPALPSLAIAHSIRTPYLADFNLRRVCRPSAGSCPDTQIPSH